MLYTQPPNIIYEAQITNKFNDEHKKYLDAAETSFKERYSNNTRDCKHKKYRKFTGFSKFICSLKNHSITLTLKLHQITENYA